MGIEIIKYNDNLYDKWNRFVLNDSFNGTFLQTKAFLNYHGSRFVDESVVFVKDGAIVAVCPATRIEDNGKLIFSSHCGSTFGGLVVAKNYNKISDFQEILNVFEAYLKANGFSEVVLKQTSDLFCNDRNELVYYTLFKEGYLNYDELSFALEFPPANFDVVANFKSKTRNLYKASLKNGLVIKEIRTREEITIFHKILTKSLLKHNAKPVHSVDELIDLQENRIKENVAFYGVFWGEKMIAGSMVFIINDIFHTQYLCADPDYLYLKPMDYMDGSLIQMAYDRGFSGFSFGISTEEHGAVLNENLAKYKYGFGTNYYMNKTFYKVFK